VSIAILFMSLMAELVICHHNWLRGSAKRHMPPTEGCTWCMFSGRQAVSTLSTPAMQSLFNLMSALLLLCCLQYTPVEGYCNTGDSCMSCPQWSGLTLQEVVEAVFLLCFSSMCFCACTVVFVRQVLRRLYAANLLSTYIYHDTCLCMA
jgi:hypothetical protein